MQLTLKFIAKNQDFFYSKKEKKIEILRGSIYGFIITFDLEKKNTDNTIVIVITIQLWYI